MDTNTFVRENVTQLSVTQGVGAGPVFRADLSFSSDVQKKLQEATKKLEDSKAKKAKLESDLRSAIEKISMTQGKYELLPSRPKPRGLLRLRVTGPWL